MEQENEQNHPPQFSSNNPQNELTEYRMYEHPLLPKRLVKIGWCWPAFLVGPAYLIYRRLWILAVIWIVAIVAARSLAITFVSDCDGCYLSHDDMNAIENIAGVALLLGVTFLGFGTNLIWEKDLIKRGYIMTKSLRARSMDDALAIIEREKNNPLFSIAVHESNLPQSSKSPVALNKSHTTNSDNPNREINYYDKLIVLTAIAIFILILLYSALTK